GTSPLYAVRQCFRSMNVNDEAAVLHILSLIVWSLTMVVTVKYVLVIMRADNRGEGGILALTALALRAVPKSGRAKEIVIAIGLMGAALFYGDSVLTPAISVLSAVEGLQVATPAFAPYILPIVIVLIVGLFSMQSRGTERVGRLFGPVMLVWFLTLGALGLFQIVQRPAVLLALNPYYAIDMFLQFPGTSFVLLGAVVLAVTGAESLYTDMGHFGREPIRVAWLFLVFPCLLLNYFGQGALLLSVPEAVENPFYRMVPEWGLYPMVVLASAATIIASQAVISGAFSLTRQAVQLGYLPRLEIRHTSAEEIGQVFVPRVNKILFIAVIAVVLGFRNSSNLGSAYGVAVTGTMLIDSILALIYMRGVLKWSWLKAAPLFGTFLIIDLAFFGANMLRVDEGGWFPLVLAALVAVTMSTWRWGRQSLLERRGRNALTLEEFVATLKPGRPIRVPGTAIFMTGNAGIVPAALLHNLKHNKVLHERIVMMTVRTLDIPRVPEEERLQIRHLDGNFHAINVQYGFLDQPNIPRALAQCRLQQFHFNLMETSFFVGREKIIPARRGGLARWRKRLFVLMSNNMLDATEFFRIPPNRVVELGGQVEL
ncbi:MAG TPA: potassium transporter Kup, partial [Alphaproteobacteria bacterium]|nr:potassium transporter Kup [Alphaproteobacteria bacterium]